MKAYDLNIDGIFRFVFFKVGNKEEAEDITSLTFLKCWDYLQRHSVKEYKTLKSLFYKVARNLVIDHYRKKSKVEPFTADLDTLRTVVNENEDMAKKLETASEYELVRKKIMELKDEYRETIVLSYINELSITEIARITGKSKGNVRVLIFRALNALKDLVDEELKGGKWTANIR